MSTAYQILLPLIDAYMAAFNPRVIVVKIFKLKRLLLQSTVAELYASELSADYEAKCAAVQTVWCWERRERGVGEERARDRGGARGRRG